MSKSISDVNIHAYEQDSDLGKRRIKIGEFCPTVIQYVILPFRWLLEVILPLTLDGHIDKTNGRLNTAE